MLRRPAVTLGLLVMMLASAWLVLRVPDMNAAVAFFSNGIPTMVAGVAVMALLAWLVIAVAICATFVRAIREARGAHPNGKLIPSASMLLAVGLLLLVLGVVQRTLPATSICCGAGPANLREATQLAR
jgi:hypothetical protein